jgi:hypothetical protein
VRDISSQAQREGRADTPALRELQELARRCSERERELHARGAVGLSDYRRALEAQRRREAFRVVHGGQG